MCPRGLGRREPAGTHQVLDDCSNDGREAARRHPELRVLWHAGLVEIMAHVIVADVDEYWLHDHTRYLQSLRTEAAKWFFAARNNSGEECGDGSRPLHLAACGLLLVPRSQLDEP